jgi:hypothetical protein
VLVCERAETGAKTLVEQTRGWRDLWLWVFHGRRRVATGVREGASMSRSRGLAGWERDAADESVVSVREISLVGGRGVDESPRRRGVDLEAASGDTDHVDIPAA